MSSIIKALFLGAGRRNTLAEMFISRGIGVYSYEVDERWPISDVVQIIKGLAWNDEFSTEHISSLIDSYNIDIVIPLHDTSIPIASKIAKGVCSSFSVAETCFDKLKFEAFMEREFPEIYPSTDEGETIKKDAYGYSSKNITTHSGPLKRKEGFVYQSLKRGKEYTVDAYFNRKSICIGTCPRIRIRTAGGEIVDSVTENNLLLSKYTIEVGRKLGLVGPVCMQYILQEDGQAFLFEINARFGGGSTLSITAGLDMIDMIKKEYIEKQELAYGDYKVKYNLMVKRSFKDYYYNG